MSQPSPARAVFISYAREDAEAARRIADALRAFQVEVWFDQNELRGGDAWDQKIRRQIKECALFLPVVSATTQSRGEGYFRREWKLGIDRTHDMAPGVAFIVPVTIDETAADDASVPEEFLRYHWTPLPQGVPTPDFVQQIKHLLTPPRTAAGAPRAPSPQQRQGAPLAKLPKGDRGDAIGNQAAGAGASHRRSRAPRLLGIGAALAVVGAAAWLLLAPSHKTREAGPPAVPPQAAPALLNDKSIAVLPFENMSEEKDNNAFFADGIHEDILTDLSLVKALRVVSRTSVMQYKGTTKSIPEIARELNVAYILEGSVRRAGNKVRVTGQLIKAASDEHVWAKAYDHDITDIFSIQSEIAQAIAEAMQTELSPSEKTLLDRRPTDNAEAYDLYMRARERRASNGTIGDIEALLKTAIDLDPKFAAAYGALGSDYAFAYFNSDDRTEARLAAAKTAIEAAQQLAPDDPAVIENTGDYYYYGYRDYAKARDCYLRLAELRPNDSSTYRSLALICRREGKWRESVGYFRKAMQLDPADLENAESLIELLVSGGHYDEADDIGRQVRPLLIRSVATAGTYAAIPFFRNGDSSRQREFANMPFPAAMRDAKEYGMRTISLSIGDYPAALRSFEQFPGLIVAGDPLNAQGEEHAAALYDAGRDAEARALAAEQIPILRDELKRQPQNEFMWEDLGVVEAIAGERERARADADHGVALLPESRDAVMGPELALSRASVLGLIGDKDSAIQEFGRLFRTTFGANVNVCRLGTIMGAPTRPLREDPRFQAMLKDPKYNEPTF